MCIAQSKSKKREKETEWGRRAEELRDLETREMIWKEDGQLLISGLPSSSSPLLIITPVCELPVVSEYEKNEKANRQSLRMKESESAELQSTYASLRENRKAHRLSSPLESLSSPISSCASAPVPSDSVSRFHGALLLRQLNPRVEDIDAAGVLESWQQEHLVNYFQRSVDTLSVGDIHRSVLSSTPTHPPQVAF